MTLYCTILYIIIELYIKNEYYYQTFRDTPVPLPPPETAPVTIYDIILPSLSCLYPFLNISNTKKCGLHDLEEPEFLTALCKTTVLV